MPTKTPKPAPAPRALSAVGGEGAAAPAKKAAAPQEAIKKPEVAAKGTRTDFEAMERDYRTGAFTDQELATKFGKSRQAITKMAKAKGWKKDLTTAVRQATRASLIADEATKKVAEQVAKGSNATINTVLAVAETNKQVILNHRADITEARDLTLSMLNELKAVTINPAKMRDLLEILVGGDDMTETQIAEARAAFNEVTRLPTRILSVQRLSQAMSRLQLLERKAFGLDDEEDPASAELAKTTMTEAQRASRLASIIAKARGLQAAQVAEGGAGVA